MKKIEDHIKFLEFLIQDLDEHAANYGKNKAIRDKETRKISNSVSLFKYYLGNNSDLAALLLKYHNGSYFGVDETLSYRYLVRDVGMFPGFYIT